MPTLKKVTKLTVEVIPTFTLLEAFLFSACIALVGPRVHCEHYKLFIVHFLLQVIHAVYKRFEIRPHRYFPTILLLGLPPLATSSMYQQTFTAVWFSSIVSFVAFYTFLLLSIAIYRLSPWHPLSEYPGPFVARVSKFWMASVVSKGKANEYLKHLHDKYGPYVRIGKSL